MSKEKNIKDNISSNSSLAEVALNTNIGQISASKEFKSGRYNRLIKSFYFVLILIVEVILVFVVFEKVNDENLNYRIMKEIENITDGKNVFETGTYIGETDFGYLEGKGTFNFSSGNIYEGQLKNNELYGLGRLEIPKEGHYEGEFLNSQKSGKGKFTWENGTTYEGQWKSDQMYGKGTYLIEGVAKYTGIFKENRFYEGTSEVNNDTGKYLAEYKDFKIESIKVIFSDGSKYVGSINTEDFSGNGNITYSNGDNYIGEWIGGKRSKEGVYTWSNKDQYKGTWSKNSMNGAGKYLYANGSYAEGEFEKNILKHGEYKVEDSFGQYTFKISNERAVSVNMDFENGTKYYGDLDGGKMTGKAKIIYSSGDTYEGHIVDGNKSGKGSYTWKSGASYDGEWDSDKMNGNGTYYYSTGETGVKLVGNFEKGVPNGECQYYETGSKSYKTDWLNGECIKVYE